MAQQNTVGAGGEATGSGGTFSFSVGQIDFSSQSGTTGSITQGVQQPLEFFNVGIAEQKTDFTVLMYPNPVVAELHVDLQNVSLEKLTYVLTDVTGKIIETKNIHSELIRKINLNYGIQCFSWVG